MSEDEIVAHLFADRALRIRVLRRIGVLSENGQDDPRLVLANYMSGLSQDHWYTSWLVDQEFLLWAWLQGEDFLPSWAEDFGSVWSMEERALLHTLHESCGGWIRYRREKQVDGVRFFEVSNVHPDSPFVFVPTEEWEALYASYAAHREANGQSFSVISRGWSGS